MTINTRRTASLLMTALLAATVHGHFLWLKLVPQEGSTDSRLFFSESAHQENYHLPEAILNAEIWQTDMTGKRTRLEMQEAEDAEILHRPLEGGGSRCIATTCAYGNYHGSLLTYYAKSIYPARLSDLAKVGSDKNQKLDIAVGWKDGKVTLALHWNGQPRPNSEFTVTAPSGKQQQLRSRDTGEVVFTPLETGIHGILTHIEDKDAKGEFDGESYKGAHHYATLSIHLAKQSVTMESSKDEQKTTQYPHLVEAVSSFGAAVLGDHLYVYSGHTGKAHAHSLSNLSKHFRRLNLADPSQGWEDLPMQLPLQGVPLVAHGKHVYRIGGLNARNANPEEDADLHSTATASRFDTESLQWEDLPNLPAGRSSHDAVIHDDHLYVIGGWNLSGDSDGEWHDSMLVMDLTADKLSWKSIPALPFQKRALATASWGGKVFAICGMDQYGSVDRTVHQFDPATQEWSRGPSLAGDGMDGFGVSAWGCQEGLFMSGHDGVLHRLSDDGQAWDKAGQLESGRFFHRLLPQGEQQLIAVGGASHTGHLRSMEAVTIAEPNSEPDSVD